METVLSAARPVVADGRADLAAYRALQALVRARPLPERVARVACRPSRDDSVIHAGEVGEPARSVWLITDRSAILKLLKDPSLLTVDLGARIEARARQHGFDPAPLLAFIQANPITLSGAAHREARTLFQDHHQSIRQRLREVLPEMARAHFQALIDTPPAGSAAGHLAEPFVDQVLGQVFEFEHPELRALYRPLARRREQIFAFLHHPARLAELSRTLADAFQHATARIGRERFAQLLAYVLMGRDPLLGALGAFVQTLIGETPEGRERRLQAASAGELFEQAAPVNYLVRVAPSSMNLPEGQDVHAGDLLVLMLGWIATGPNASPAEPLAFGSGRHVCAGRALAIDLAGQWLSGLRETHHRIDWGLLNRDRPAGSAFLVWAERRETDPASHASQKVAKCPFG
jgi:hypothetical protein